MTISSSRGGSRPPEHASCKSFTIASNRIVCLLTYKTRYIRWRKEKKKREEGGRVRWGEGKRVRGRVRGRARGTTRGREGG